MPVKRCRSDNKPGWKWGSSGACYTYKSGDDKSSKRAKKKAVAQGIAIGDIDVTQPTFLLTELQDEALVDGKPFDGFIAGEFTDMHGRAIIVEDDELEEYFTNTQAAIEAVKDEDGEPAGLPIDITDHDKGDAAGWIVGANFEDGIVRFTPQWTEIGVEVIEKKLRKFFSATFDTEEKVILGGSLTNWPATRDEERHVLLRPIELAELSGLWTFELQDEESTEDRLRRIQADFTEQFPNFDNRPYMWIEDTFDDENFVIVNEGARHFRVDFSENDDGDFDFSDRTGWVEVKQSWIDAARQAARDIIMQGPLSRAAAALRRRGSRKPTKPEGDKMTMKLDDLSTEQRHELALGLFAELAGSEHDSADLGERFNQLVVTEATSMVEKQTVKAARESNIAEFSKDITGGTDESPVGIPVKPEEVEAFLAMLSDEALEVAKGIFGRIQTEGLVSFTENGHGRPVDGAKELPEEYAAKLDSGEMDLEDLKEPVLGLGDLSAYDLNKWAGRKKEEA